MRNLNHLFLPECDIQSISLIPEYEEWLRSWLFDIENDIADGDVASSICLQGIISEIVLFKEIKTDWLGILKEFLTDDQGNPLAYSSEFGKRLYKFDHQWLQTPIHAIHTRWWIERLLNHQPEISYGSLVESFIQTNGWIYNPNVSPTKVNTRMKSELLMSLVMGIEILNYFDMLTPYKEKFEATISSFPLTGYVAAEYFRIRALQELGTSDLSPVNLGSMIQSCEAGKGYCDFAVEQKIDDYMGTVKRTQRDKAVHSPLISLFAYYLSHYCDTNACSSITDKILSFGRYLSTNPFDIPAFRMRDIDIPFGTDISPLEVISANNIINLSINL